VHAGSDACCSLSWDIVCSRYDDNFAQLVVSGLTERNDGKYDTLYWVEDRPLVAGDQLSLACIPGSGTSQVARLHTHEELEELRTEVNRGVAAGEYDAARALPRTPLRASCAIELQTPDGNPREVRADGSVMTVLCSGIWSNHHRPTEWRLRLWSMPVPKSLAGFWQPIAGGAHVTLRA
jgi:hypothetical protein